MKSENKIKSTINDLDTMKLVTVYQEYLRWNVDKWSTLEEVRKCR